VTGLGFEPEIDDLGGPFQPRAGRPPDHPSSPYCWRGIPLDLNVRRDALGFHGRGLPWTNPNCVSFGVTDVPITIAVDISTKDIASSRVTKSYGAIIINRAFISPIPLLLEYCGEFLHHFLLARFPDFTMTIGESH
jgi:hypothetical protein